MRVALALACFLAAIAPTRAEAPTVTFGGERYYLAYQDTSVRPDGAPANGLAEFTLAGETVDDWTKLFTFNAYPESGDDPVLAAQTLGEVVKEANKDAAYAVAENENEGVAIIDFLTTTPGSDTMEFNVFKYARAQYGPGLVALQFAQRIEPGEIAPADFQKLRARAVENMAQADVAQARAFFQARARPRLGGSTD